MINYENLKGEPVPLAISQELLKYSEEINRDYNITTALDGYGAAMLLDEVVKKYGVKGDDPPPENTWKDYLGYDPEDIRWEARQDPNP